MNFAAKSVSAVALVLSLAACGGGAEEADDVNAPDAAATASLEVPGMDLPPPAASETPMADATPGATPSPGVTPGATPAPTPSASATTAAAAPAPTPTPTRVAASGPPPAFAQCSACHAVAPGKNGIGPSLAGVFGAKAGHEPSYAYSEALDNSGLTWNEATLERFLANPMGTVAGTKMAYPGLKDAAQRDAVIEYLKGL